MAHFSPHYRLFVGIDVAATTCAVSWMRPSAQPARAITIKQMPAGFAALQRQIQAIEPNPHSVLIVREATGTYWMRLAISLSEAGFAVSVINPALAHDFAIALLKRSKTDAIDAQTLAHGSSLSLGGHLPRSTPNSTSVLCIVMDWSRRAPNFATSYMLWCSNRL